jgi:hypothetical protein
VINFERTLAGFSHTLALQLTRAARGALQDRRHFENQKRLIDAFSRRGQLNAKPLGRNPSNHYLITSKLISQS